MNFQALLENGPVEASAPCRIDMGGTLDLSTFFLPLRHLKPCTFNIALDMRTKVHLSSFDAGKIKVSSHGFDSVVVDASAAPFDHPLGLMLAVATYFDAEGLHIKIHSSSPPRSALGGSSVAASALIWAFSKALVNCGGEMPDPSAVAVLAHAIEQSVAGVPCGLQDQLAAVYGGVNAWHWNAEPSALPFTRQALATGDDYKAIEQRLLVAYCGAPHVSKDINTTWVKQFVAGHSRSQWYEIADCSRRFISAMMSRDFPLAQQVMNRETDIRCELTPAVLDEVGGALVACARDSGCSARFTGAGGGGCVWALGEGENLELLRQKWEQILHRHKDARMLAAGIDMQGLL